MTGGSSSIAIPWPVRNFCGRSVPNGRNPAPPRFPLLTCSSRETACLPASMRPAQNSPCGRAWLYCARATAWIFSPGPAWRSEDLSFATSADGKYLLMIWPTTMNSDVPSADPADASGFRNALPRLPHPTQRLRTGCSTNTACLRLSASAIRRAPSGCPSPSAWRSHSSQFLQNRFPQNVGSCISWS